MTYEHHHPAETSKRWRGYQIIIIIITLTPDKADPRNIPKSDSIYPFCDWRDRDYFYLGDIIGSGSTAWNSSCDEGRALTLRYDHGQLVESSKSRRQYELIINNY